MTLRQTSRNWTKSCSHSFSSQLIQLGATNRVLMERGSSSLTSPCSVSSSCKQALLKSLVSAFLRFSLCARKHKLKAVCFAFALHFPQNHCCKRGREKKSLIKFKECRKWSEWYFRCLAEHWLVRSDWDYAGKKWPHTYLQTCTCCTNNLLAIPRPCFRAVSDYVHTAMYTWGDVCLSLRFHHPAQLSFFTRLSYPASSPPFSFSFSWTPLLIFFKPSKPVSYQTCNCKKPDH